MTKPPQLASLGPWRGAANVYDEASPNYAPRDDGPAFLREAVNVDFDRDGYVRRRVGHQQVYPLLDGHSLAAVGPYLLVMDGGELYSLHVDQAAVAATKLVQGLARAPMSWVFAGVEAYGCNGTDAVRVISAHNARPWALPTPPAPALETAFGALQAGTYGVTATAVTKDGRESGASPVATIDVPEAGGIRVSQVHLHPLAAEANLYLTTTNGSVPYYAGTMAARDDEVVLTQLPVTHDPCETIGLSGPPQGADLVQAFKGRVLVAAGSALYWSQPLAYHLFDQAQDLQLFPTPLRLIAPLDTGFYVADRDTLYWCAGAEPSEWSIRPVSSVSVSRSQPLLLPAEKVPSLESPGLAALWMTSDGLMAGLEGGQTRLLSRDRVAVPAHQQASLVHREEAGVSQVLASLQERTRGNGFTATDRAECVVTRSQSIR